MTRKLVAKFAAPRAAYLDDQVPHSSKAHVLELSDEVLVTDEYTWYEDNQVFIDRDLCEVPLTELMTSPYLQTVYIRNR